MIRSRDGAERQDDALKDLAGSPGWPVLRSRVVDLMKAQQQVAMEEGRKEGADANAMFLAIGKYWGLDLVNQELDRIETILLKDDGKRD